MHELGQIELAWIEIGVVQAQQTALLHGQPGKRVVLVIAPRLERGIRVIKELGTPTFDDSTVPRNRHSAAPPTE
jgi:hypothetical protein